jgi:hypothetical protein
MRGERPPTQEWQVCSNHFPLLRSASVQEECQAGNVPKCDDFLTREHDEADKICVEAGQCASVSGNGLLALLAPSPASLGGPSRAIDGAELSPRSDPPGYNLHCRLYRRVSQTFRPNSTTTPRTMLATSSGIVIAAFLSGAAGPAPLWVASPASLNALSETECRMSTTGGNGRQVRTSPQMDDPLVRERLRGTNESCSSPHDLCGYPFGGNSSNSSASAAFPAALGAHSPCQGAERGVCGRLATSVRPLRMR